MKITKKNLKLVELAALAYSLDEVDEQWGGFNSDGGMCRLDGTVFNPIDNCADAFELLCKLGISISFEACSVVGSGIYESSGAECEEIYITAREKCTCERMTLDDMKKARSAVNKVITKLAAKYAKIAGIEAYRYRNFKFESVEKPTIH